MSRMQSAPSTRASNTWYSSMMKSLAEYGEIRCRLRLRQVCVRALEEGFVGQHGQACGTCGFVAGRDGLRIEVLADHAPAG